MKGSILLFVVFGIFSFSKNESITAPAPAPDPAPGPGHFYGAWKMEVDNITYLKIFTADYFIYSAYNVEAKIFNHAAGGTWVMDADGITEIYEFHSNQSDQVGEKIEYRFEDSHDSQPLTILTETDKGTKKEVWKKVDKGQSPLFGAWRITQRERNGEMSSMSMGPRKTMKVLSGTHFQWAAYNVETKQFSGTGGGTFTTENGKYTENIEFFSRDNSRVGASLDFDYEVKGKDWHHKGYSSKGNPIHEVWTNQAN